MRVFESTRPRSKFNCLLLRNYVPLPERSCRHTRARKHVGFFGQRSPISSQPRSCCLRLPMLTICEQHSTGLVWSGWQGKQKVPVKRKKKAKTSQPDGIRSLAALATRPGSPFCVGGRWSGHHTRPHTHTHTHTHTRAHTTPSRPSPSQPHYEKRGALIGARSDRTAKSGKSLSWSHIGHVRSFHHCIPHQEMAHGVGGWT